MPSWIAAIASTLVVLAVAHPARAIRSCDSPPAALAAARAAIDIACPCHAAGRKEWMRCVNDALREIVATTGLSAECRATLKVCLSASTCGRARRVACCVTTEHGPRCRITTATKCDRAGGCVSEAPSCCDACDGASCATTSTTTSTSTTSTSTTTTTETTTSTESTTTTESSIPTTTLATELQRLACCATQVGEDLCVRSVPHVILFSARGAVCPGGMFIDGMIPSGTTSCATAGGGGVVGECVPAPPLPEPVAMCLWAGPSASTQTACRGVTTASHLSWSNEVWAWAFEHYAQAWGYVRGTCGPTGACTPAE